MNGMDNRNKVDILLWVCVVISIFALYFSDPFLAVLFFIAALTISWFRLSISRLMG